MPTVQDALAYARAGIPVFPLNGKRPIEKSGEENIDGWLIPEGKGGFHQATCDASKIERWARAYPGCNWGTPTGHHVDPITNMVNEHSFDVVDIDPRHGGDTSLEAMVAANAPMPAETPTQLTGTNGLHYLFSCAGTIANSAGGIAPGIDVRGRGGYIVISPSIHPDTGRAYEWQVPLILDDGTVNQLQPWPKWLVELVLDRNERRKTPEAGARIPLGIQEATLMRIAGAMRRHGSTQSEILAALKVISQERCDPEVQDPDLERMARSASSYAPGDTLLGFPLDDGGNAERLVMRYGDRIRHMSDMPPERGWLYFRGRYWDDEGLPHVVQDQLEMARAYQDAVAELPEELPEEIAAKRAHKANAKTCAQDRGMVSMRRVVATFPEINLSRSELDSDPFLFACANGVIDLRDGSLRPHIASDLITRYSEVPYDPGARSQLWDDYLKWLTREREDLQEFLQMAAGYSMTADTREEKLFFIHGPAASGKTTFVETFKSIMGKYSATADFSTFLKGHNVGGPRQDIARLNGARYVSSIEVDQGKALAEGLVKQMTGGDTITSRFLYGVEFEYTTTHKLWLVANDAPKVNSEDDGLWRRILRIPCDNVVPEGQRDTQLKPKLRDPQGAAQAVLAWAVEGCLKWRERGGLTVPASVTEATAEYRDSQDAVKAFVTETCVTGSEYSCPFGELWMAYIGWCKTYSQRPMGKITFGDRLEANGYKRGRSAQSRNISGLMLVTSDFL